MLGGPDMLSYFMTCHGVFRLALFREMNWRPFILRFAMAAPRIVEQKLSRFLLKGSSGESVGEK